MNPGPRPQRLADWLNDMLDAIHLARGYVDGIDKSRFLEDRKTQQAVILNLMILGEAASRISGSDPSFIGAHPEIPWAQMRGMRNRMAHGYFEVDLDVVWDTVRESLPGLESYLVDILKRV